jgi:hypothetical protein
VPFEAETYRDGDLSALPQEIETFIEHLRNHDREVAIKAIVRKPKALARE